MAEFKSPNLNIDKYFHSAKMPTVYSINEQLKKLVDKQWIDDFRVGTI